ncbi:Phage tail assembly chaperone protein [Pseudomonas saponiphila]|uniref:Phage tail assembly chaperone protein n=1 Tax=Pseudomonas saponiphila TaxID=556534 RepID=A0A1H4QYD6_9PSED|nr:tail fiber assembly protein [Pseudomonas saponiphila]SEC24461.1 Phage tail assembly chaperone protein [Pseudomonas saponiphila]
MKRFYSQTTQTSYLQGLHAVLPDDAVEIPDALYLAVIGNPPSGKIRVHDEHGLPHLVDAPMVVPDLMGQEREWRDAELSAVVWLRERHRDQLEIEAPTTLKEEQFKELLVYMQALREWPQSPDFPVPSFRPRPPAWMVDLVE